MALLPGSKLNTHAAYRGTNFLNFPNSFSSFFIFPLVRVTTSLRAQASSGEVRRI